MADTVLITGATGTLGGAFVRSFSAAGSDVALHFKTNETAADMLLEVVRMSGRKGIALQADFDQQDVDGISDFLIRTCEAQLDAPNVVVINASSQLITPWETLNAAQWDEVYAGSIRAAAAMIRAASNSMKNNDKTNNCIVVIGSIEGIRPAVNHAPYAAMKAALHHLVAAAAFELGSHNIRVVGVAPGLVDRTGLDTDWPEGVERYQKTAALGRTVRADEVASVVQFVASSAASGVTGITIPVDAGWSSHPGW